MLLLSRTLMGTCTLAHSICKYTNCTYLLLCMDEEKFKKENMKKREEKRDHLFYFGTNIMRM